MKRRGKWSGKRVDVRQNWKEQLFTPKHNRAGGGEGSRRRWPRWTRCDRDEVSSDFSASKKSPQFFTYSLYVGRNRARSS
jgi:hypothetical protein